MKNMYTVIRQIYVNFRQALSFIRQGYFFAGVFWFLVRTKTGCFPSFNFSKSPPDLVNQGFQLLPAISDTLKKEIVEYFLNRVGCNGQTLNQYFQSARADGVVRPPAIHISCTNLLKRIFSETNIDKLAIEYLSLDADKIAFSAAIDALIVMDKCEEINTGYDGALEFHRDVDSFRFFKTFVYLTDCYEGYGHHEYILGSHKNIPLKLRSIKRYTVEELKSTLLDRFDLIKVIGPSGMTFAEITSGFHRGTRPMKGHRLLLTFSFNDLFSSKFIDLDRKFKRLNHF